MMTAAAPQAALRTWIVTGAGACLLASMPLRAAPIIYSQPAHQSPVRGEPDDLLLLPGHGFAANDTVVYRQIDSSDISPTPPATLPASSTADSGLAPVVSDKHVPYALTVRLPESMAAGQTYALWAHSAKGEWSNAVLINDARPLWLSPAFMFASEPVASLPRILKIIGRNLQPAPGQVTRVRLSGPQQHILQAQADESSSRLGEHVAAAPLPKRLATGTYHVAVSRDGRSWVPLAGQTLQVRSDPEPQQEFSPDEAAFGGCQADDGNDDALCLQRAIAAAATAGGGVIRLGGGQWDLFDSRAPGLAAGEGLRLPRNVNLRGAGQENTTLIRHARWHGTTPHPALTLDGGNQISGFRFQDSQRYSHRTQAAPFIRLGSATASSTTGPGRQTITDLVITANTFDRVMLAIGDSGAPIERLLVTYNEFGAYHAGIRLAGGFFNMDVPFRIDDSVIAHNRFHPGSWLDIADRQGALATELGAGHRVDFSNNIADGASTRYLNSLDDARGWRAGFFWHLNGNQEKLLVADNVLTCTGDKVGDGEAIAYDNNGNTFAFDTGATVLSAASDSITVEGPLLTSQNGRKVAEASYYLGHWIQVGAGPGLGQVRKIVSYQQDAPGRRVTFKISPAWDVLPATNTSRISIGREFWQVYTLGNHIDHRQPPCIKGNRSDPKGGGISLFAQMADAVVAGNQQFDSDGILLQNQFTARDPTCKDCYRGTHYINFVDVHHNLIDGEYDWSKDCSSSGILGSLAAGPGSPPLTTTYGLNIAHNTIRHADAWQGGAIAMTPTWHQGPAPHRWPLVDNTLIQHNTLTDMWSGPARSCGTARTGRRTGISLGNASLAWRSVLYANVCTRIPQAMILTASQQTTSLCKSGMADACECQR